MKNSDYELTYGVEIEFVLVFHQKLIFAQSEHDAGNPTICNNDFRVDEAQINAYLEKNLAPEVRIQMNPAPQVYHQTRPQYLAWGIRVGAREVPEITAATYSADGMFRSYKHEHLHIAREVLRSADQNEHLQYWDAAFPSDITIDIRLAKPTTFDNWHLIKELVIEALTQTELEHYLATYKRCFERDGPTSGQRSKRSLSPDISSAGGSVPKKLKSTQSPFSMSSSFQSNDTNQENLPPNPNGESIAQITTSMPSSFQSNDKNQENVTPKKEEKTASKADASQTSSSLAFHDPFQQDSNPFLRGPDRFSLGPTPSGRDPLDLTPSFESVMKCLPWHRFHPLDPLATAQASRSNPGVWMVSSNQQSEAIDHGDPNVFSLIKFYDPSNFAFDRKRRTLNRILGWSDAELESEHDYIGVLFPLPEYSDDYPDAPLVDEATFHAFNTRQDVRSGLLRSLDRMWQFFGFQRVQHSSVKRGENYSTAIRRWAKKDRSDHNDARIMRIIRSLRILGLPREAFYFYWVLTAIRDPEHRGDWIGAVQDPLYRTPDQGDLRQTHPFLEPGYSLLPKMPATFTAAVPSNVPPPPTTRPGGQRTMTSATSGQPSNTPPSQTTFSGRQQTTASATSRRPINAPPSQITLSSRQQTATSAISGQPNKTAPDEPNSFITVTSPDRTTPTKPIRTSNEMINLPAATAARTTSSEPQARLPETSEWDSQGAELVSRVFTLTRDETGFPEINDLCNRLKGQPCHLHGATSSPKTGLHVHMKHAHGDIDHETLQNLLYILVMYERQINTILPHHRRTDSTSDTAQNELRSNCTNIHYPDDNDPRPNQAYPATERPLDEVRTRIFEQDGSVLHGLIFLSGGGKDRAVNFTYLEDDPDKPNRPHTIEFRQHESVLRGEMIQYWVRFCAGLLRLANHRAHFQAPQIPYARPGAATRDGRIWRRLTAGQIAHYTGTSTPLMRTDRLPNFDSRGFPFAEWDDSMSIFDLIEEMELDDETTQYFHRRAAFFAAQDPDSPNIMASGPRNTDPSTQDPNLPIATPLATQITNPSAQGEPGPPQQPHSVGSSEASTTIAPQRSPWQNLTDFQTRLCEVLELIARHPL
ncbi:hypothetical protein MMC17_005105 [Xylographa soralifera]|nr:hypothetical protein [Xylographa soralifera]